MPDATPQIAALTDDQALDIGMTHLRNQAEAGYPWAIAVVAEVERLREQRDDAWTEIEYLRAIRNRRVAEVERLRKVESDAREIYPLLFAILTGADIWVDTPLGERCTRAANEAQQAFRRLPGENPDA